MSDLWQVGKSLSQTYGMSVVPIRPDKKIPPMPWASYQTERMGADELVGFLKAPGARIGIVTGAISKQLECLDFDDPSIFELWKELLYENGLDDIYAKLVVERTPSGGTHCFYRCPEGVEKNQKLARRRATPEELAENPKNLYPVTIETRGNGGLVVCHPSVNYAEVQSDLGHVQEITASERIQLLEAARHFEQVFEEKPQYVGPRDLTATGRPGDDYNSRAEWAMILEPQGWVITAHIRERTYWRRPGKDVGEHSATTGNGPKDYLYVHSTSCHPLEAQVPYTKFGVTAIYDFGGDFASCAKALFKKGYGDRTVSSSEIEDTPKPKRFTLWTATEILSQPPKPMLIKDLLGERDLWMLFGHSGCGKTFSILDLLLACAVGGTWAGMFDCTRSLKVVYCYGEGKYGINGRLSSLLAYHDLSPLDIKDTFRFLPDIPQLHQLDSDRSIHAFIKECEESGFSPDVFVLDTKSRATLGSKEDDNGEAAMVCDLLTGVAEQMNCSPGFVHHTGWDKSKNNPNPRGASAFMGAMDLMLFQEMEDDSQEGKLKLYKGKDIKPFAPIPFEVIPYNGSAVIELSGGFEKDDHKALLVALEFLQAQETDDWLLLSQINCKGHHPDAVRMALNREANSQYPAVERSSEIPSRYRRVRLPNK